MSKRPSQATHDTSATQTAAAHEPLVVCGENLTIHDVVRVARHHVPVQLTTAEKAVRRINASCDYITNAVATGEAIYGVTTGFGGMANVAIASKDAAALQDNLIWHLKTGAGKPLPVADVRAAMLLRMNSLARGVSGIRLQIIRRLETFLNAGVTPHVREFGSIGASGDLVPLASITGALTGLDACFRVDFNGEEVDARSALKRLGLRPIRLRAKEGLAMINGTAVMTGIAANCVYDAHVLLALAMTAHALMLQGLHGTNQSFHPFIHAHKPHPGQVWAAAQMLDLLTGSQLIRDELDGRHEHRGHDPIQDRYSLRCLPQYMGPIVDSLQQIRQQIEVEMNAATDNPLIDAEHQVSYHGGNFLGQYVGVAMDQLRYALGLLAKHLDAQIALLVAPEFNNGLSPCLVGNTGRRINMGLKGLQIAGNSIMPLITFFGNSLVDRFPTHAEQFNQNINSQGFGSANLARQALETLQHYMAIAMMFGVQAVDLRTHKVAGHYDARVCLSPATRPIYETIRQVVERPPSAKRPYLWNNDEHHLEAHLAQIAADIAAGGRIPQALYATRLLEASAAA